MENRNGIPGFATELGKTIVEVAELLTSPNGDGATSSGQILLAAI